MKRNKLQAAKTRQSVTVVIVTGTIIALVLSALLSVILTTLMLNGRLQEGSTGPIVLVIRMISIFAGAIIGGTLLKEKYLLQVSLTALSYILVLIGIGIVFYDEGIKGILSGVVSVVVGSVVALLILQRPRSKGRRTGKLNI